MKNTKNINEHSTTNGNNNVRSKERERFREWLVQQIIANEGLLKEMERIGVAEVARKKMQEETTAYATVAGILENTESMGI